MTPSQVGAVSGYERAAASSFRLARFSIFLDLVNLIPPMDRPLRILDVGGVEAYWSDKRPLIGRPTEITLLNLDGGGFTNPGFVSLRGNGCHMPEFADGSFDVVHSNSVIEHVGQWSSMVAMAKEIRRVARSYFVQTPYFWFPIEPHARTPFLHWLPESLKFRLVMARKCGPYWSKAATVDDAMRTVQSSSLLDRAMFSALFPDATVIPEKVFGVTKSLMAVRNGFAAPAAGERQSRGSGILQRSIPWQLKSRNDRQRENDSVAARPRRSGLGAAHPARNSCRTW